MSKSKLIGKVMAAMEAFRGWKKYFKDLFSGKKDTSNKQSPWQRKHRMVKRDVIWPYACYNKSILRLYDRAKRKIHIPITPTSATMNSINGSRYRVFSDGSYRRMWAVKGRNLIPV